MKKLWSGRFTKETDARVDDFHSSISFDQRLFREDIAGSIAHATMLGEQSIISKLEAGQLVSGLRALQKDIEAGQITIGDHYEDIHMAVESLLTERIGDVAKKLHTGRSRNDQVALDFRLYTKRACDEVVAAIDALIEVLVAQSECHLQTIMPGYTHLQRAQPITLAHHLMAYAWMLERDRSRFLDAKKRMNFSPLGSGALSTSGLPLKRERVAEILGFAGITQNSLDAVSDRDFAVEFISGASITMMHLSRLCEEWILWASQEFKFIELDEGFSTGSSMMPQKKNPDVAELVRGKTGRVYGNLLGILTMLKGLPLAYNKDMQEDKEALFSAHDTLQSCLEILAPMIETTRFQVDALWAATADGFMNATEVADHLVRKGLAFREAHEVAGKAVQVAIAQGAKLEDLSAEAWKSLSPKFAEFSPDEMKEFSHALQIESAVMARTLPGGPAPAAVLQSIQILRARIKKVE